MTLIERTFRERIVLVGVVFPWTSADAVEADLDELALLVDTAGADVVGRVVQRRDRPDPATYVGRGKAEELHELSLSPSTADTVVFDDELSPGPAAQPREDPGPHGHRPHRGDPRHLRPERPHPGGQGPGRAGPAALPAAPAAGRGRALSASRPAASAPGDRARPSSRWTAGACCAA